MPDLNTIFGTEINVSEQPRRSQRQFSGFAGAHGLTALHLGTRGKVVTISGTLRAAGVSYNAALAALKAALAVLEAYQWAIIADYTYRGVAYPNAVFEDFKLVKKSNGKMFTRTSTGCVTCNFTINLICLI